MLRSFYSGISGLRNFQTKLDVVSNNIANVNTVGFKSSRVMFQDIMSQTISGATAPTDTTGGVNPKQIGLGATISSIDTKFNQGSPQTTNYPTDLYINGDGFFVVEDPAGNRFLTRAGNFRFDVNGNLTTPEGYFVLGVSKDGRAMQRITLQETTTSFRIDQNGKLIENPGINESIVRGVRVDVTDGTTDTFTLQNPPITPIYDDGGDQDGITVYLNGQRAEDLGFTVTKQVNAGTAGPPATPPTIGIQITDANGQAPEAGYTITVDYPTGEVSNKVTGIDTTGDGTNDEFVYTLKNKPLHPNDGGMKIEIYDTLNNGIFTSPLQEGTDYKIDYVNGTITFFTDPTNGGTQQFVVRYSYEQANEETYTIHTVVVDNPAGLEKIGNNMYMLTTNADRNPNLLNELTVYDVPNSRGAGSVWAGYLEMSNVDLSEEFTEMIIAQRGFQANSRIITTSDEVLQELVNLKR